MGGSLLPVPGWWQSYLQRDRDQFYLKLWFRVSDFFTFPKLLNYKLSKRCCLHVVIWLENFQRKPHSVFDKRQNSTVKKTCTLLYSRSLWFFSDSHTWNVMTLIRWLWITAVMMMVMMMTKKAAAGSIFGVFPTYITVINDQCQPGLLNAVSLNPEAGRLQTSRICGRDSGYMTCLPSVAACDHFNIRSLNTEISQDVLRLIAIQTLASMFP